MGLGPSAVEFETEDRAGRIHLLDRQIVLRVAGQEGMVDLGHPAFQETPDQKRILALPANPQVERLQPLQHHPGVERREVGSGIALEPQQLFIDKFGAA